MLGDALYQELSKYHEVSGCDLVELDHVIDIVDLTNDDDLERVLSSRDFDVLIHTAAMINVDGCEDNPDLAYNLNSTLTKKLSEICRVKKSKMVYISTDAVFSGNKDGAYTEEDNVDPINVYGSSKLKGEDYIQDILDDYLILRTNIYGWNKQNKQSFAEWVYNSYLKGEEFNMFTDVLYTPIYVGNFAKALNEILDKNIQGLYNFTGSEHCSKFDFGIALGKVFGFDTNIVNKISVDSFSFKALRSKNMRIDSKKIQEKINTKLLSLEEGLKAFYYDIKKMKE